MARAAGLRVVGVAVGRRVHPRVARVVARRERRELHLDVGRRVAGEEDGLAVPVAGGSGADRLRARGGRAAELEREAPLVVRVHAGRVHALQLHEGVGHRRALRGDDAAGDHDARVGRVRAHPRREGDLPEDRAVGRPRPAGEHALGFHVRVRALDEERLLALEVVHGQGGAVGREQDPRDAVARRAEPQPDARPRDPRDGAAERVVAAAVDAAFPEGDPGPARHLHVRAADAQRQPVPAAADLHVVGGQRHAVVGPDHGTVARRIGELREARAPARALLVPDRALLGRREGARDDPLATDAGEHRRGDPHAGERADREGQPPPKRSGRREVGGHLGTLPPGLRTRPSPVGGAARDPEADTAAPPKRRHASRKACRSNSRQRPVAGSSA